MNKQHDGNADTVSSSDRLLDIYLAHRKRFVSWVTAMTGCPAYAEDIVQEAFIQIAATARRGVVVFSPIGYLTIMVRRLAIDHLKSAQRRQVPTEIDHALMAQAGAVAPTPEEQLTRRQELDSIDAALAGLPIRTRRAFEMYRAEGYTLREIAESMGISTARVHTMIQSALATCAEACSDQES